MGSHNGFDKPQPFLLSAKGLIFVDQALGGPISPDELRIGDGLKAKLHRGVDDQLPVCADGVLGPHGHGDPQPRKSLPEDGFWALGPGVSSPGFSFGKRNGSLSQSRKGHTSGFFVWRKATAPKAKSEKRGTKGAELSKPQLMLWFYVAITSVKPSRIVETPGMGNGGCWVLGD